MALCMTFHLLVAPAAALVGVAALQRLSLHPAQRLALSENSACSDRQAQAHRDLLRCLKTPLYALASSRPANDV